jgi:hypothetical protein
MTQIPTSIPASGAGSIVSVLAVLVSVLEFLSIASFVGVLIIAVVANRAEPDPSGRRPQSVYCFAVSFVTILLAVFSATLGMVAIVSMIGSNGSDMPATRLAVIALLFLLVSLGLLLTHLRRGVDLAVSSESPASPSTRVGQSYVAAISFIAVLIVILMSVTAVYLALNLISPSVFGVPGGRGSITRVLVDVAFLGACALAILRTHRNLIPPGFHLLRDRPLPSSPSRAPTQT